MADELCSKCGERPVGIKKWRLCLRCYQAMRMLRLAAKEPLVSPLSRTQKNMTMFKREMDFAKNFFEHKNWLYEPCAFSLSPSTYCPDFYDQTRNVFIEVVGTRQAYAQNKAKYKEFSKTYPHFKLEFRHPDGTMFDPKNPRHASHQTQRR